MRKLVQRTFVLGMALMILLNSFVIGGCDGQAFAEEEHLWGITARTQLGYYDQVDIDEEGFLRAIEEALRARQSELNIWSINIRHELNHVEVRVLHEECTEPIINYLRSRALYQDGSVYFDIGPIEEMRLSRPFSWYILRIALGVFAVYVLLIILIIIVPIIKKKRLRKGQDLEHNTTNIK